MPRTLLLVVVALAGLAGAVSCSQQEEPRIEVTYGDFVRDIDVVQSIEVAPGTTFEVSLFTNPQSGFVWGGAEISDPIVLSQRNSEFVPLYGEQPHESEPAGMSVFTLEAMCKGKTTAVFRYNRPSEEGQTGVWTVTLDVVVR